MTSSEQSPQPAGLRGDSVHKPIPPSPSLSHESLAVPEYEKAEGGDNVCGNQDFFDAHTTLRSLTLTDKLESHE